MTEADEDTIKYWFNAYAQKQKEVAVLLNILSLAEEYISDDSDEKDSIDFYQALYQYREEQGENL